MTVFTAATTVTLNIAPTQVVSPGWSLTDRFTIHRLTNLGLTTTFYGITSAVTLRLTQTQKQVLALHLAQALQFSSSFTTRITLGVPLTERLRLHDATAPSATYGVSRADLFSLAASLSAGRLVTLHENLTIHDASSVVMGVFLAQVMRLHDGTTPNVAYGLALADRMRLTSALHNFANILLTEHLTVSALPTYSYHASALLSESLHMTPALSRQMVFQITSDEELELTDLDILHMIYKGDALQDGLLITALYVAPDGNYTTWAINTRTNAVTEYENWVFNSFATFGRKYVGANSAGIFELNGERDETANIVSTIENGLMQMGGTRFAGLQGAYIAARGEGKWLMRLRAGDGREYTYQFQLQPNLMTTRIQVGKGLRSRFFSVMLQNLDGQDFDFESLEFVPILSTRRV
jgi:hypothetical protein